MKNNSYDHASYMQKKMLSYSANADYSKAMKVYKLFAYVSGAAITAVYFVSQMM
ncbi:MAG: hypothetical protein IJ697_05690 [Synergistaceae bacterium]|nr:hypothetical protein [Synergistaceae bacterium]